MVSRVVPALTIRERNRRNARRVNRFQKRSQIVEPLLDRVGVPLALPGSRSNGAQRRVDVDFFVGDDVLPGVPKDLDELEPALPSSRRLANAVDQKEAFAPTNSALPQPRRVLNARVLLTDDRREHTAPANSKKFNRFNKPSAEKRSTAKSRR